MLQRSENKTFYLAVVLQTNNYNSVSLAMRIEFSRISPITSFTITSYIKIYTVFQKNIPDVFSYKSRKH